MRLVCVDPTGLRRDRSRTENRKRSDPRLCEGAKAAVGGVGIAGMSWSKFAPQRRHEKRLCVRLRFTPDEGWEIVA